MSFRRARRNSLQLPPRCERCELFLRSPRLDAALSERGDFRAQPLLCGGNISRSLRVGVAFDEHAAFDSFGGERFCYHIAEQLAFERMHANLWIAERIGIDHAADDHAGPL